MQLYVLDVYHLINPTTKRYIISKNVTLLKKICCEWAHVKEPLVLSVTTSVDDEEIISSLAEKLVFISDNDSDDL